MGLNLTDQQKLEVMYGLGAANAVYNLNNGANQIVVGATLVYPPDTGVTEPGYSVLQKLKGSKN
jgi:hypothetical protein